MNWYFVDLSDLQITNKPKNSLMHKCIDEKDKLKLRIRYKIFLIAKKCDELTKLTNCVNSSTALYYENLGRLS